MRKKALHYWHSPYLPRSPRCPTLTGHVTRIKSKVTCRKCLRKMGVLKKRK